MEVINTVLIMKNVHNPTNEMSDKISAAISNTTVRNTFF
jgi:hypothetical protein